MARSDGRAAIFWLTVRSSVRSSAPMGLRAARVAERVDVGDAGSCGVC